jgi:hypothetical protein
MNNVSIYGIPTRMKFVNLSLRLLLPLIFASLYLNFKTPALVSQHISTLLSNVLARIFNLGNILMGYYQLGPAQFSDFSTDECKSCQEGTCVLK